MKRFLVVFLISLLSFSALSQEQPVVLERVPLSEDNTPAELEIVPIKKGAVAPFSGLLVPEERFVELLQAELRAELLEGKLRIKDKTERALESMYQRHLKRATEPIPWYEKPSFNRWLGFGIGVIFTGLAIYGTVQISK